MTYIVCIAHKSTCLTITVRSLSCQKRGRLTSERDAILSFNIDWLSSYLPGYISLSLSVETCSYLPNAEPVGNRTASLFTKRKSNWLTFSFLLFILCVCVIPNFSSHVQKSYLGPLMFGFFCLYFIKITVFVFFLLTNKTRNKSEPRRVITVTFKFIQNHSKDDENLHQLAASEKSTTFSDNQRLQLYNQEYFIKLNPKLISWFIFIPNKFDLIKSLTSECQCEICHVKDWRTLTCRNQVLSVELRYSRSTAAIQVVISS